MALNNLFGDLGLDSTLQKIAVYLGQLAHSVGNWYPNSSGQMPVSVSNQIAVVGSVLYNGNVTVTQTAAALPTITLGQGATIRANPINQYPIYFGNSALTTGNGQPLYPGESISLPINNLNLIYIVSANSTTDTITYTGV